MTNSYKDYDLNKEKNLVSEIETEATDPDKVNNRNNIRLLHL